MSLFSMIKKSVLVCQGKCFLANTFLSSHFFVEKASSIEPVDQNRRLSSIVDIYLTK